MSVTILAKTNGLSKKLEVLRLINLLKKWWQSLWQADRPPDLDRLHRAFEDVFCKRAG